MIPTFTSVAVSINTTDKVRKQLNLCPVLKIKNNINNLKRKILC